MDTRQDHPLAQLEALQRLIYDGKTFSRLLDDPDVVNVGHLQLRMDTNGLAVGTPYSTAMMARR